MIVQCPSCASRYRIRDANIPASGGKIRCPSCSHSFIVYPEAPQDDDDRTSITSQGEISNLVDQMASGDRVRPEEEDDVATQIADGDLDKMRAMQALKNELGDPMDMDGTVEIQNPMDVWRAAQSAQAQRQSNQFDEPTEDEYQQGATEVVDPNNLKLPFTPSGPATIPTPAVSQGSGLGAPMVDESDPTFQMDREKIRAMDPMNQPRQGDSSPNLDPTGLGSGVHPYAQNTPPSGQQPQNNAQPQAQRNMPPQVPSPASGSQDSYAAQRPQSGSFDQPPPRNQSPSGLQAADLFGGSDDDLPPTMDNNPSPADPPLQPSGPSSGGAIPDPNHPGPWKLKTNFGLTYEFPDTRGLRSWLSNREELDGYTVSGDGENFFALGDFPQLDRSSGRQSVPSGNFSVPASHGSGLNQRPAGLDAPQPPQPGGPGSADRNPTGATPYQSGLNSMPPRANQTMKGPKVNNDYRPPSRENKARGLLWVVFFLLLLVAVVIGVQTFGIFDIKGFVDTNILGKQPAPEPVTQPVTQPRDTPTKPAVDPAQVERKRAAEVETLLKDAQRLIDGNKLPSALEKLETTLRVAPEEPRVYDMKADVHERLGQADASEAAAAKAEELRAAAAPNAGAEGEEDTPEGEGEPTDPDQESE